MRKVCCFLLIIFSSFNCLIAQAQPLKNIADFKNKVSGLQRTSLSLYNNMVYVGEFTSYIDDQGNLVSIDYKSFDKLMKQFLIAEKYEEFKNNFFGKSILSREELNVFGFDLILDLNNFKLDVRTSELFLNPSSTSLNTYTLDQNEINFRDSTISGFLNYSFSNQYQKEKNKQGQNTLNGTVNSNFNFMGVNFEDYEIYTNDRGFDRAATRVVKDFEKSNLRISFGDQFYTPRVFQGSYQSLGFKIKKEFETTPFTVMTARGEGEVYLETPSFVEIFVNGILIQTLNLEAGKHKIEDIPIIQGINHIILRISDSAGNKKFVEVKQTGNDTMLKPGIHDYEYNAGTIASTQDFRNIYSNDSVFSAFHRYGVNTAWTTGIGGQYRTGFYNIGPENQLGTSRGLFVHNLTFSQDRASQRGISNRIAYYWTCPCGIDDQVKRLAIAYDYQSSGYLTNFLEGSLNTSGIRHSLLTSYSQRLTETISGLFSGNIYSSDLQKIIKEQVTIGLNKKINNNLFLSTNFNLVNYRDNKTTDEASILIQLNFNFDGGKKNMVGSFYKNESSYSNQVDYTYNKNAAVNNNIFRARIRNQEKENEVSLSHYLNTSKFELAGALDYQSLNQNRQITLNPSGSIAFAGTGFSLGQRIYNSFAVIKNDQNEPLIVNGDSDNYEAYLHPHSQAVITNMQSYVPKNINIISDDNRSDGFNNKGFKVLTSYKAGSLLQLGDSKLKRAEGILLNSLGEPYQYAGGKIVNLSSGKEIKFFTGKNGKFYLENIAADVYQMIIYDKKSVKILNLNLKDSLQKNTNDLGKIIVN